MSRRQVTIRWSLLRNLLLLVVLLSGSILAFTFLQARQIVVGLTTISLERTTAQTETELRRFFQPVKGALVIARDWTTRGALRCREPDDIVRMLLPALDEFQQISSVNTGDPDGGGVLLLRETDGWLVREVRHEEWEGRARWTRLAPEGSKLETWEEDLDYDPRTRPWYRAAMAASAGPGDGGQDIHWTEPYTFFTTQDPGITASIRTWNDDGRPWVVAFDVLLNDVSKYTRGLRPTPNGVAFVIDASGAVVGLPMHERWADEETAREAVLTPAADLAWGPLSETARRGFARGEGETGAFSFEADGEIWWGDLRPFKLEGGPTFLIGVAVPERDLLGDIRRQRNIIIALTAAALLGAALLSVVLSRRYSRPLEELASQSDRIRDLDTRPAAFTPSPLVEITRLHDAQERMRGALDSFARYVPTEVVRDLLQRGEAARIGGRTETLTVLFTDIEGFTSISEGLSPDELTSHMADYFDVMLTRLRQSGATIDKLIGDAIVAFWGAPNPVPEHPRRAVDGVLACLDALAALNEKWVAEGKPPLPTRFGLTTGPAVVGNVGTPARLHYTALGDTMNLASRLEAANKLYGTYVLAEERVVAEAGDGFVWRQLDRVAVKGRHGAVDVFELLGRRETLSDPDAERSRRYEEAFAQYQARDFEAALEVLRAMEQDGLEDAAVQRLVHLCRAYRSQPPGDDWDGVARLQSK